MKERILVSRAELQRMLNEQLAEYAECDGCTLKRPWALRKPRAYGRNWSIDVHVTCVGRRANAADCAKIAVRIVAEAARDYNLKDWPEGTQVRAVEQSSEPKGKA